MAVTLILTVFATVIGSLIVSPVVQADNIVFYCGVSSYSHRVPMMPLATALAEKGHNVTFVSPFPSKTPNPKIHDFIPQKLKEWSDGFADMIDMFEERKTMKVTDSLMMMPMFGKMACDVLYSDDEFVKWVTETKVDLVFVDAVCNECGYGMAHYWNAKMVMFDTTSAFSFYPDAFGTPDETNWIPDMDTHYSPPMTFFQRTTNALMPLAWDLLRKWIYFPYLENLTREKLNISDLPRFADIERNASFVFLNTHYGEEFARSLPPNVVSIGGIAWNEKRKPLPQDLEAFLKKGSGFVYVSFGTFADFTKLDHNKQQAIIGAMKSFPDMQFVWKVSNESLAQEFPNKNVFIGKWMPQQDILSHPKIKAFVTHSGLMGIQEAVYSSVPLICFPIFAEQDYNAERVHRREYGIKLEITTVTQDQLEDAIKRVLTDPKYRENMKRVSTMFKERPQKPVETALWWTEFVLRHTKEELTALRPLSVGQSFWKKRQLDVWLFLFGATLTLSTLMLLIVVKGLKYCCCKSSSAAKESRKKKTQ